jgi:hypothetical protein
MAHSPGTGRTPSELDAVLRGAAARIFVTRFLRSLVIALAVAVGVLVAALIAQRVFAFPFDWTIAWAVAGAGALVFALLVTMLSNPDRAAVARRVDDAANLRESISTALVVGTADDAWSRAAVDSARDRAKGVRLHESMPVRAPSNWWVPFAPAVLFALGWFLLPQWDALGANKERQADQEAKIELISAKEQADEATRKVESMLREMGREDLLPEDAPEADVPQPATPEEIRRSAIRKLTTVKEELTKLKDSPASLAAEQMKDRLAQLRQPGQGPLNEMVSKLQRGDFAGAREALEELQKEMDSGEMTPEQRAALEKQMRALGDQLAQLAQQADELKDALENAGMNPDLANDMQALQQALEQNPQGLSQQQLDQLQKMAQATKQSQGQCQSMGQCAGGGSAGMGAMGDQLSDLEMASKQAAGAGKSLSDTLAQLDALAQLDQQAQGDIMSLLDKPVRDQKQGMWQSGGNGQGSGSGGMGGRGQGQGAGANYQEGAFTTKQDKAATKNQGGPVVGRMFIDGVQIRGESKAEFQAAASAAESAAAEAIDDRRVPREHQDAVKRYFGRLKRAVEGTPTPEPAPPAEPAPAAEDSTSPGNN